jgi:hypothetical protein
MKKLLSLLCAIILTAIALFANPLFAQNDYKYPYLNAGGEVLDSVGVKLGGITPEGIIYNYKGEKVASVEELELLDNNRHLLGKIGNKGTFYDARGAVVFTIEPNSKGEKCKVFNSKGKVVATVHEGFKNQVCAIYCLHKGMRKY